MLDIVSGKRERSTSSRLPLTDRGRKKIPRGDLISSSQPHSSASTCSSGASKKPMARGKVWTSDSGSMRHSMVMRSMRREPAARSGILYPGRTVI